MTLNNNSMRYVAEQLSLSEKLRRSLEGDDQILAAWLNPPIAHGPEGELSDIVVTVVVSDEDFQEFQQNPNRYREYAQQVERILIFGPETRENPYGYKGISVLYYGTIAPHCLSWEWYPRSKASLPHKSVDLLFDRVGVPWEDEETSIVGRVIVRTMLIESPEEKVTRKFNDFWLFLVFELGYGVDGGKADISLTHLTCESLNAVEKFLGIKTTVLEDLVRDLRFSEFIEVARRLVARGTLLMTLLSARGIEIPDHDTPQQVLRYINLAEEISNNLG